MTTKQIDEAAMALIKENTDCIWDWVGAAPDDDHARITLLAEIHGIVEMAEAVKEMLG